jgi:hypothetical protein
LKRKNVLNSPSGISAYLSGFVPHVSCLCCWV